MAQPSPYNRETDFTTRDGDDTDHAALNAELDGAAQSINEIRDNLAKIQRDDGGLKNGIVGADQLAPDAFDAFQGELNQAVQAAQVAANESTRAAVAAVEAEDAAEESAQAAAQSASNAASSAANAAGAAMAALETIYYGPLASNPTTDPNGQPINEGDFYFNTTTREWRAYSADIDDWVPAQRSGSFRRVLFNAGVDFTAGTSTSLPFDVSLDAVKAENVFVSFSGVNQHYSQFTIDGSAIDFVDPIPAGVQQVEVAYMEALLTAVTIDGLDGSLSPAPGFPLVPKVSTGYPAGDALLNAQAQSLADRTENLKQELAQTSADIQAQLEGFTEQRDGNLSLKTIVSIVDFGGVDDCPGDDTGTNNIAAFSKAFTYLNSIGGGDLVLPRTNTGIYFVNGDDPTQVLSPVRLVPATGVSIRLIYSGGAANSPLVNTELKSETQIPIYFANFGFTSFVGGNVGKHLGDILPTVNNGDGVFAKPVSSPASEWTVIALSDPSTAITPTAATADALSFDGAGQERCAVKSVDVGDEVFTLLTSIGGTFFAGVITASGSAYVLQNSGTQEVSYKESAVGHPAILLGIPYNQIMNQQRDNFNNALLSVKVTSSRTFSVLVNGLVVYSAETRSVITGVAFGSEDINAAVTLSQMTVVKGGKSFGGIKPLNILMVGDSITDTNVQYSHAKYLQMVLGSAGISIAQINNIAVSGETAAAQYARLQTVGAGYDLCCIQIGVNDVQAGTDYGAFIATIVGMCNYSKSVGMQPIVAIPTAFYSRAEAQANGQAGGQDTSNNASLHSYRAVLIRAVAAAGALLNLESLKAYGAMTAKWLSVTPYSSSDRIVCDNIHPTPYGSMMLAQGWARSIIGWAIRPDATKSEAFEEIPVSWLAEGFGIDTKPSIRGRELKGALSLHASSSSDGAVAFTLPAWMRPEAVTCKPVVAMNSSGLPVGTCSMYIGQDGKVYFFALPAGTIRVQLDGATI